MEEEEAEPHGHHTHIMHQYMVRNVWLRISAEYRFQPGNFYLFVEYEALPHSNAV